MLTFYKDEEVIYLSYYDGEKKRGRIEYFTESGMKTVAAIREDERILLITLADLEKISQTKSFFHEKRDE